MDLSAGQAAAVLNVSAVRARQLLRSGDLPARRVGSTWVVRSEDVHAMAAVARPSGRALSPARVWGLLDLLDGGRAPWLDDSARSKMRSAARTFPGRSAPQLASLLRNRAAVHRVRLHPSAVRRVTALTGAVRAGPRFAAEGGADLVVVGEVPEIYLDEPGWDAVVARYRPEERAIEPNLVVRVPAGMFGPPVTGSATPAVLAADLLGSVEPRAASAGREWLLDLARMSVSR
jgi:excisionase family DNA binding protein